MKHFIVELTYTVPFEQLADMVPVHRAHLQTGYDSGMLLISGPQVPRVGGFMLARANSLEELQQFCARDPYQLQGLAAYRFVEFAPVKFQPFLAEWLKED